MNAHDLMDSYLNDKCFCDFVDPSTMKSLKEMSVQRGKVITVLSTAVNGNIKEDDDGEPYEKEMAQLSMVHIYGDDVYGSIFNLATNSPVRDNMKFALEISDDDISNAVPMNNKLSTIINIAFKEHIVIGHDFYHGDFKNIKDSMARRGLKSAYPAEFYDMGRLINTMEMRRNIADLDMQMGVMKVDYDNPIFNNDTTISRAVKLVALSNAFFEKYSVEQVMQLYGTPEEKKAQVQMLHSSDYIEGGNDAMVSTDGIEKSIQKSISEMPFEEFIVRAECVETHGLPNVMYVLNEMLDTNRLSFDEIVLDQGKKDRVANFVGIELDNEFFDYSRILEDELLFSDDFLDISYPNIYLKSLLSERGMSWPEKRKTAGVQVGSNASAQTYEIDFDM